MGGSKEPALDGQDTAAAEYIGGVITEEVLIERLTKRAELYLAEKL